MRQTCQSCSVMPLLLRMRQSVESSALTLSTSRVSAPMVSIIVTPNALRRASVIAFSPDRRITVFATRLLVVLPRCSLPKRLSSPSMVSSARPARRAMRSSPRFAGLSVDSWFATSCSSGKLFRRAVRCSVASSENDVTKADPSREAISQLRSVSKACAMRSLAIGCVLPAT